MDFRNAQELLALCEEHQLPISEIMRQREITVGESTADSVDSQMKRVLEIMKDAAFSPIKSPVKSMGGLIGGEAQKLSRHIASGKGICGDVLEKAITYAMATLETNASMGLIVASPTAGSAGIVPGMMLALQEVYGFSDEKIRQALFNAGAIDKKFYMENLQLEEAEYELIRYPQRGVCLYKCGTDRHLLAVHAPSHKEQLFGSAGGR